MAKGHKKSTGTSPLVLFCGCDSNNKTAIDRGTKPEAFEFQDAEHGPGMRVHNPNAAGDLFCTLCGKNNGNNPAYSFKKHGGGKKPA